jgi:hypothetical protein
MKEFLFYLKSRGNRLDLIPEYLLLLGKQLLGRQFSDKRETNAQKIDVLIPTATKDLPLLKDVVVSLKNINHPLNKIYIVSPETEELKRFCQENSLVFVNELDVLPYDKGQIEYRVKGQDRSGWIYQQLLKLSGDKIVEQENYFVLDADTLLINNINLIENGRFVFFQNKEWNEPYFATFKKLFGYPTTNKLSFTSHMMIFNKKMLQEMKNEIEEKHGQNWDKVYISMADPEEASCISDYDNYANWVLIHHPSLVKQKPLYNKGLSRSKLLSLDDLEKIYGPHYKTISFHSYIK